MVVRALHRYRRCVLLSIPLGFGSLLLCYLVPLLGPFAVASCFLVVVSDAYAAASALKQAYPERVGLAHTLRGAASIGSAVILYLGGTVGAAAVAIWALGYLI